MQDTKITGIPAIELLPHPETGVLVPEEWKSVPDFPDYEISNYGRTVSHKNGEPLLRKTYAQKGYPLIKFSKNNKSKSFLAHRLVATCFIPNPENKLEVNHKDRNKANAFVFNLEWATKQENTDHAWANGVMESVNRGENCWKAKLTENQVLEIRATYIPSIMSFYKLAAKFGVTYGAIQSIVRRKSWKHI